MTLPETMLCTGVFSGIAISIPLCCFFFSHVIGSVLSPNSEVIFISLPSIGSLYSIFLCLSTVASAATAQVTRAQVATATSHGAALLGCFSTACVDTCFTVIGSMPSLIASIRSWRFFWLSLFSIINAFILLRLFLSYASIVHQVIFSMNFSFIFLPIFEKISFLSETLFSVVRYSIASFWSGLRLTPIPAPVASNPHFCWSRKLRYASASCSLVASMVASHDSLDLESGHVSGVVFGCSTDMKNR